jgi:hypothetical protein
MEHRMNRQARPYLAAAAFATLFATGIASAAIRPSVDGQDRAGRREERQDHRKDKQEVRQDHREARQEVRQDRREDRREDRQDFRQDRREDRHDVRQDRREDRQDFRRDQARRDAPRVVVEPRYDVRREVVQPRRDVRAEHREMRRVAYDRYRTGYDRRRHDFHVSVVPRYYVRPAHYRYSYGGRWYSTSNYGADILRQAVSWGYQEGVRAGRADRYDGWAPDLRGSIAWRNGGFGYGGRYVSRADYDYYFRQGFQRGYDDGYYGRMRYGRYDGGNDAMIVEAVLATILGLQLLR